MPLVSLDEVSNDIDIGQCFSVERQNPGSYIAGGWQAGPLQTLTLYGVIGVADARALRMFPEGDRVEGTEIVICNQPLYATSESLEITSDIVIWHGLKYRVKSVAQWDDFGYHGALVTRMKGS